jgi:hypothetical protein
MKDKEKMKKYLKLHKKGYIKLIPEEVDVFTKTVGEQKKSYWWFLLLLLIIPMLFLFRDKEPELGTATTTLEDMQALYDKYGEYIQVTKDGRVLYRNQEVDEAMFKNKIPDNVEIIPYLSPEGDGFQIITRTDTTETSVGFGPEAAERTYEFDFPLTLPNTTSTPEI